MDNEATALKKIRKNIFLTACAGGVGHLASAFSIVEIIYALYIKGVLCHDSKNPTWEGRDRFILSKGHGCLALYNVLSLGGYFEEDELWTFCRPGSRMGGEPNVLELPGVEASTGSLGHGLSIGVGMALAARADNMDNKIYVLVGDGECQEGSIWEAVMAGMAFGLDNLYVILDENKLQKMGFVSDIMRINCWEERFKAFGWQVKKANGHNVADIYKQLTGEWTAGVPRVLIAQTTKGKGVSIMENAPGWHWKMPNKRELKIVMQELGITEEELEKCKRHI
ncbi:MAG: transketolase [Defluviitaleaceae bacterium]|nr:transketolase [Defluviitaleaceae bacterium]MCL2238355.1 transketolase [Defluviitaleaceae bacterium]